MVPGWWGGGHRSQIYIRVRTAGDRSVNRRATGRARFTQSYVYERIASFVLFDRIPFSVLSSETMRYSVAVLLLVALCQAQRPPYAGPPRTYPAVLPRFAETTAVPEVGGRVDADADGAVASTSSTTTIPTSSTTVPEVLPVQALGDRELYNRIKGWPKEKQPFWFLNSQKIAEHLNPTGPQTQQPPFAAQSFFAG